MGDMYTGEIIPGKEYHKLSAEEKRRFVEVKRDLTLREAADMQIKMYAPCMCGSGKKFKFCCHKPISPATAGRSLPRAESSRLSTEDPNALGESDRSVRIGGAGLATLTESAASTAPAPKTVDRTESPDLSPEHCAAKASGSVTPPTINN